MKTTLSILASSLLALTALSCGSDETARDDARTFTVSGTVTKLEGSPAAGASIRLVQLRDDNAAGESPANAAGEFTMTGVYPGSYRIITTLDGYERDTTATIEVIDTDVTVPAIILREILAPTHAISGTVTTSTGAPAVGASVQIRRASDNTSVGQVARADANGAYTITGLPEGQYNIIILLDGHTPGSSPASPSPAPTSPARTSPSSRPLSTPTLSPSTTTAPLPPSPTSLPPSPRARTAPTSPSPPQPPPSSSTASPVPPPPVPSKYKPQPTSASRSTTSSSPPTTPCPPSK